MDEEQNRKNEEENEESTPQQRPEEPGGEEAPVPQETPESEPSAAADTEAEQTPSYEVPDEPLVSPVAAALIGLLGGFVLYQFVGALIVFLVFGVTPAEGDMNLFRLMQMGMQVLFILTPALILALMVYGDVPRILRVKVPRLTEVGMFTFGIIVLTPLLYNYLGIQEFFIERLAAQYDWINTIKGALDELHKILERTYHQLLSADSFLEGLFVVLVVSVTPAICEEAMFRGYIQKSFELKIAPFLAAFVTALFFALYHFNPYAMLPLFLLGLYFGYAAYKTNSIFVPMLLHFLNNLFAIVLYYVFGDETVIVEDAATWSDLNMLLINFGMLLVIFILTIIFIERWYAARRRESAAR